MQNGYEVNAVCTTGAQVLQLANSLSGGIVVCGYRFADMMYEELHDYLPPQFEMLLVASATVCDSREREDILCLRMPLQVHELIQTMNMMSGEVIRRKKKTKKIPKERTKEEKQLLKDAKELLMGRNNMTEEEAHRYLQKLKHGEWNRSCGNSTDDFEFRKYSIINGGNGMKFTKCME